MAAFNTPILDTFNRANETPIGGNWTNVIRSSLDSNCRLISNQFTAAGPADGTAWWNVSSFPADQEAYATAVGGSNYQLLVLRLQNPGTTSDLFYSIGIRSVTQAFTIYKRDAGSWTQLSTDAGTAAAGIKYGARAVGSRLSVWQNTASEWTEVASVVDTSITNGGYIGAVIASTSTDSIILDDFGGGATVVPSWKQYPRRPAAFTPGLAR